MYKVLAIIGESGSGKDTILQEVFRKYPNLHKVINCTSRPIREKEQDGVNYYFYSIEEFQDKIKHGEILEYAIFNNWYYGTSFDSLKKDKINIGVFNPEGVRQLLERNDIQLIVVYLRRPAKLRLLGQLNREDNPNVSEIIRRAAADEIDFANLDFPYHVVPNEIYEDLIMAPRAIMQLLDVFK